MPDPRRPGAPPQSVVRNARRATDVDVPLASDAAAEATSYVTGPAALWRSELRAMIHQGPSADGDLELGPYLFGTELSPAAYNEWLARVCEQPDDE